MGLTAVLAPSKRNFDRVTELRFVSCPLPPSSTFTAAYGTIVLRTIRVATKLAPDGVRMSASPHVVQIRNITERLRGYDGGRRSISSFASTVRPDRS